MIYYFLVLAMVAIPLEAGTRKYAVEVSVWSVTGASLTVYSGMRVDALFFQKGSDGGPVTRQPVLVLRNIEVDCSWRSDNTDDRKAKITSLLLTRGEADIVRALPATAVELVVLEDAKDSRQLPFSWDLSSPPRTQGSRRPADPIYAYPSSPSQGPEADDEFVSYASSRNFFARGLQYAVWAAIALIVFKTSIGTLRGARRSRVTAGSRRA